MRPWISRHLGTLVVCGAALLVLMASSATAALVITGKDIKNNSVSTKDIKDGTLKTADLNATTRTDLKTAPFVGSACTIPNGGGTGTVTLDTATNGVITLICSTPPVSGLDNDADGDGFKKSQECHDGNVAMNPAAAETQGNRIDDNCDGTTDDGLSVGDTDSDSYAPNAGDCDDNDSLIRPDAVDTLGDGRDNNCDGVDGIA